MMKVLVTGGTGFIGSHLVKALIEMGRDVVVTSEFALRHLEKLTALGVKPSDVEVRRADLTDYREALEAVEGAEVVFHLAARVGSLEYLHGTETAELSALQTNVLIDTNVFKACLEKGIGKLIYASSCAVYPLYKQFSSYAVFSESDLGLNGLSHYAGESLATQKPLLTADSRVATINPDGGYGWAKLLGEVQLSWMKDVQIGVARIFNIYGENEDFGESTHVIPALIRKAILYPEEEFIVWGDGKQSRDFLYVSDCVDALVKMENKVSFPPLVVNIGSDKTVSISELAEKIVGISGKKIKPVYNTEKPVGPLSRKANINQAKEIIELPAKGNLKESLKRTYAWAQKRMKEENVS